MLRIWTRWPNDVAYERWFNSTNSCVELYLDRVQSSTRVSRDRWFILEEVREYSMRIIRSGSTLAVMLACLSIFTQSLYLPCTNPKQMKIRII